MKNSVFALLFAAFSLGLMSFHSEKPSANQPDVPFPDLVPVKNPTSGQLDYVMADDGTITFRVKNIGTKSCGFTTTKFFYLVNGKEHQVTLLRTIKLGPGGEATLKAPSLNDPNCFGGNCNFKVIVDFKGQVIELSEQNNTVMGTILG